jgi:hypothetical protein
MFEEFLSLFTENIEALCNTVGKVTGWASDKLRVFTKNNVEIILNFYDSYLHWLSDKIKNDARYGRTLS